MAESRAKSGGSRERAARKPKPKEDDLGRLLARAWKKADREAVVRAVVERAKAGSMEAAKLLFAYGWGRPTPRAVARQGGGETLAELVRSVLDEARKQQNGAGK